jgi:hypothetical protein
VSANDGDGGIGRIGMGDACKETRCPDDIESGYTEDTTRVIDACFFEGGRYDWDSGVNGVGYYADNGIRSNASDSCC